MSALEKYVVKHGHEIMEDYKNLISRKVVKFLGPEVNYYVGGEVELDDGEMYPVHYRWASQEEDCEGKELDDRYLPMKEYYEKYIIGRRIVDLEFGIERDDDLCIHAFVEGPFEPEDVSPFMEIPLNIDPMAIDEYGDLITTDKD
jgi:hypothetical protein